VIAAWDDGHVLPALAVADALTERGVRDDRRVAGSRRAQLVPDAGYELDAFKITASPAADAAFFSRSTGRVAPRAAADLRTSVPLVRAGGYVPGRCPRRLDDAHPGALSSRCAT
jgi:hypothetical protein